MGNNELVFGLNSHEAQTGFGKERTMKDLITAMDK
jgi:hypothetical protein